jgi:flagellar biosynthesis protein FliR
VNATDVIAQGMRIAPFIVLVSLRVGIVLALLPAPFGELAPTRIRAALSFIIAFALSIPTLGNAYSLSTDPPVMFVSALSELVIGAAIGITARVTMAAAESAGTLAGNAMGLGFAGQIDPLFGGEGVPTSMLSSSLAVLVFFTLHGHHTVLEALSASLSLAPCGKGFPTMRYEGLTMVGARVVMQGLRIASPVVATMFIVQLGTALVARSAPKVQIFSLSFGVSVSIGALVLLMSAPEYAQGLAAMVSAIPDQIARVMPGVHE